MRYTHEELVGEFPGHELVGPSGEEHRTPWGSAQQFMAVLLRRHG